MHQAYLTADKIIFCMICNGCISYLHDDTLNQISLMLQR